MTKLYLIHLRFISLNQERLCCCEAHIFWFAGFFFGCFKVKSQTFWRNKHPLYYSLIWSYSQMGGELRDYFLIFWPPFCYVLHS